MAGAYAALFIFGLVPRVVGPAPHKLQLLQAAELLWQLSCGLGQEGSLRYMGRMMLATALCSWEKKQYVP